MSRPRRRRYVRTLVCPTCGGSEFAEAQHEGGRSIGCVRCFAETGDAPEPREVLESLSDPPTRAPRLALGSAPSPLRTTRSR